MYNITLVSTIHDDIGKCNSDELHKIINSLSPDVIFEELTQDLFDRVYKENQIPNEPPEIKSIKKYLQNHNIKHIPVDIDASENLFTNNIQYMFETFKKYVAYKKLEDEQYRRTNQDGFAFLNSKECEELFETKKTIEKNIIELTINKTLFQSIYTSFHEANDRREYEIIKNIYNYSKNNFYNQAILLIGSGHRKSIIEKIEKCKSQQNVKLNWTFYSV